jgi:hypothetical protein
VKRPVLALGLTALAGVAAWQGALALQNEQSTRPSRDEAPPAAPTRPTPAPAAPATTPQAAAAAGATTPMAERVATLGVLNKRNGLWRDVQLKPGQGVRLGDLIVRLRACEATAPWEPEKLTGAFVQADVRGRDERWRRIFSGWLYKETPSLNVVEHPIYDVWPKNCTMRHPDMGPDTVSVATPAAEGASERSSAKKSPAPKPQSEPTPSAPSSNDT